MTTLLPLAHSELSFFHPEVEGLRDFASIYAVEYICCTALYAVTRLSQAPERFSRWASPSLRVRRITESLFLLPNGTGSEAVTGLPISSRMAHPPARVALSMEAKVMQTAVSLVDIQHV